MVDTNAIQNLFAAQHEFVNYPNTFRALIALFGYPGMISKDTQAALKEAAYPEMANFPALQSVLTTTKGANKEQLLNVVSQMQGKFPTFARILLRIAVK